MPQTIGERAQDVMLVCRNGHVVTDRLSMFPEQRSAHCDRCGAQTLDRCATCGAELPGAVHVPGLPPIGAARPPHYCSVCGAAFPWAERPRPERTAKDAVVALEHFLRRVPLAIRQFRWRQGDRPPFRVVDEKDLEDLLRSLLPLHFDDVRLQSRTPSYSPCTRTDLLLAAEKIAITVKHVGTAVRPAQIAAQLREDAEYYCKRRDCTTLLAFVFDPEGAVHDFATLEAAWADAGDGLERRCILASPGHPS